MGRNPIVKAQVSRFDLFSLFLQALDRVRLANPLAFQSEAGLGGFVDRRLHLTFGVVEAGQQFHLRHLFNCQPALQLFQLTGELAELAWVVDGAGIELGFMGPGSGSLSPFLLLGQTQLPAQLIATTFGGGQARQDGRPGIAFENRQRRGYLLADPLEFALGSIDACEC